MVGAIEILGTHSQTSVPKSGSRTSPALYTDSLEYAVLGSKVELGNLRVGDPFRLGMPEGSRKGCNMTEASDAEPGLGSHG